MKRNGQVMLYVIVAVVLVFMITSCCILRNWRKIMHPKQSRHERTSTVGPLEVISVENGAAIVVKEKGRRPRKSGKGGEQIVTLANIEAPSTGDWVQKSTEHLKGLAGAKVTVEVERHGILRSDTGDDSQPEAIEKEALLESEEVAAHGPLSGKVLGESGINLNLAQIEGGYARCTADAPKDWLAAEKLAKKKKLGMWSKGK